jgi:DNA mismatch repair protein MutL
LDQHAAHERVLITELKRAFETAQVTNQALLFPVAVEVTKAECKQVARGAELLARLGLDVRVRSDHAVSIHSIPQVLSRSSPEQLLRDVCGVLSGAKKEGDIDVDAILGRLACVEAVQAGDRLQYETGDGLLRSLSVADFELKCPHGRVIVGMTPISDLERKAGRGS